MPPLFFRTKLDEPSLFPSKNGTFIEFGSDLHGSHNGLIWEVLGKNSRFLHNTIIPHHDFFFVFIRAIFFFSFFLSIFALENQRRAPAFR